MINFAHRGFRGKYPENTRLAFKKAIEAGVSGIEFDIHLTNDGEIVIIHDESLERTTNGSGLIKDKSLKQLKELNAAKLFPQYEKEEILTLREYFDLAKDWEIITNIELKTSIIDYENIEKMTYDLIKEYGMEEKIIISSFNHNSLIRFKELAPNIKCGVLESSRLYKPWEYVKNLEMEYFHPLNFTLTREVIEKMRENNIGINVWFGISDYDFSEYLIEGVSGLITDYPDKVKKLIER